MTPTMSPRKQHCYGGGKSNCLLTTKSAWKGNFLPSASVYNTLLDLQNFSYPTKAEFNNCFIIYSKYFQTPKGELVKPTLTPLQL